MTEKTDHKTKALAALDAALKNAHTLAPGREQRYLIADLATAIDELCEIVPQVRPRKTAAGKPKVKPRDRNPRDVAILGGGPSL